MEKKSILRLFFGVRLSQDTNDQAAHLIRQLALLTEASNHKIVWVPRQNLHATVRFLGNVPETELETLKIVGAQVAAQHSPIEVQVGELGAFPSVEQARSIWVDMKEKGEKGFLASSHSRLFALAEDLEKELQAHGFPPEKRGFVAHFTLGRVKEGHDVRMLLDRFPNYQLGTCQISELILFKSDLRPAGPAYAPLELFPLKG